MHIITGGAFNGKAAWIKETYLFEQRTYHWYNAYEEELPKDLQKISGTLIFEGIEQWIYEWMKDKELNDIREHGRSLIEQWLAWEQEQEENQLIIICTDISKGIVPMDATMRKWRDVTGWFYQDLVKESEQVHMIWYGIVKQLK